MTQQVENIHAANQVRTGLLVRGIARLIGVTLFVGTPLFVGAGTFDWVRGWLLLALFALTFPFSLLIMYTKNPKLLRERWKKQQGTKTFDKVFGVVYLLVCLALFAFAGMDTVRYQWTEMPWTALYVGVVLHFVGTVPMLWSMLVNPHLETTVRIQADRGHRVISSGPYRYVCHPMYVGIIFMFLGWALVLGSWVALGIAGFVVFLFFVRTALEDKTLRNELEGYVEFCSKTRYRLIPGVW